MYDDNNQLQSFGSFKKRFEKNSERSRYQKLRKKYNQNEDLQLRSIFALSLTGVERYLLEVIANRKRLNLSETLRLLLYDAYDRIVEDERGEDF